MQGIRGGVAAIAVVIAMPASAQGWGLLDRMDGKTLVTAASSSYYTVCTVAIAQDVTMACRNAGDNSSYTIRFDADGNVTRTGDGTARASHAEYREKGVIISSDTNVSLWRLDGQAIAVTSRSLVNGEYLYSSARYVVADPLDILSAVTVSMRYSNAGQRDGAPGTKVPTAFKWMMMDRDGQLGMVVPPDAQAGEAPPPITAAAPQFPSARPAPAVPRGGPRLALVIGNSRYGRMGDLPNPARDATLIAASLRRSGFAVETITDADQRALKAAIARFGGKLRAAGRSATGLFYYAGHGLQVLGQNYLIPVGATIDAEADVDLEAVPAEAILSQMEQAGVATSIVILDACRNVPILRRDRAADRGLARMDAPNGSFVAYSTAPGQTASDGSGANSPFAAALAQEMARPGQPIETTFRNVRAAVFDATGGKQTPWDSSSLFRSFYFSGE